jgi:hypothetical protein
VPVAFNAATAFSIAFSRAICASIRGPGDGGSSIRAPNWADLLENRRFSPNPAFGRN